MVQANSGALPAHTFCNGLATTYGHNPTACFETRCKTAQTFWNSFWIPNVLKGGQHWVAVIAKKVNQKCALWSCDIECIDCLQDEISATTHLRKTQTHIAISRVPINNAMLFYYDCYLVACFCSCTSVKALPRCGFPGETCKQGELGGSQKYWVHVQLERIRYCFSVVNRWSLIGSRFWWGWQGVMALSSIYNWLACMQTGPLPTSRKIYKDPYSKAP